MVKVALEGNKNHRAIPEIVDMGMLSKLASSKEIKEKWPEQYKLLNLMEKDFLKRGAQIDAKILGLEEDGTKYFCRLVKYRHGFIEGTRLAPENNVGVGVIKGMFRNLILRKFSSDIDVKNCHMSILAEICRREKLEAPALQEYNTNREKILEDIWKYYGLDETLLSKKKLRDVAKGIFIKIGYGGGYEKLSKKQLDDYFGKAPNKNIKAQKVFVENYTNEDEEYHPFIVKFHEDINRVLKEIVKRNPDLVELTRKKNLAKECVKEGDIPGASAFLLALDGDKVLTFKEGGKLSLLGGKGHVTDQGCRMETLIREISEGHDGALTEMELKEIGEKIRKTKPCYSRDGAAFFIIRMKLEERKTLQWIDRKELVSSRKRTNPKLKRGLKVLEKPSFKNPRGKGYTAYSKTYGKGLFNSSCSTIFTRYENEILNALLVFLAERNIVVSWLY
jgi:hypothetical protein